MASCVTFSLCAHFIVLTCLSITEGINESWSRKSKKLSESQIENLLKNHDDYLESQNATLDSILKVRPSESKNHEEVQIFIIKSMKTLGWTVDVDYFCDSTPVGGKLFANILATYNPEACKRLVFACHYDSKLTESNKFVGAIDSAVPCMMLITLANRLRNRMKKQKMMDISLQFIFFDGEEAFENWTDTDSLYGSRHLAKKWANKPFPDTEEETEQCGGDIETELNRIEVFILLDLLGAEYPKFFSYFDETYPLYQRLMDIETKLVEMELLEKKNLMTKYFNGIRTPAWIQDDHIPFMKHNVPILHIIPYPFPPTWHKDDDNRENLHDATINNLIKIFNVFIVEYLHL